MLRTAFECDDPDVERDPAEPVLDPRDAEPPELGV
jgi:hypothetical protein